MVAIRPFRGIRYNPERVGNVQAVVGRQSFDAQKLTENIDAFVAHIKKIRPQTVKGTYIKRMCLSATMSPSVTVAV